jgi:hypothetical protein
MKPYARLRLSFDGANEGSYKQVSVWGGLTAVPVFAWELTLAIWLIAKGFAVAPDARRLDR